MWTKVTVRLNGSSGDDDRAGANLPVATDVLKGDGLAGTRCSERVKVKLNVPLVRVGLGATCWWGTNWLEYDPDRRAASAPNVPDVSKRERRSAENVECIGGLRSPWRAVRRVPGLSVAGRRVVRSVLEEQCIVDPSLLMVVDFLGTDLTPEAAQEKWLADTAKYLIDLLLTGFRGHADGEGRGHREPVGCRLGGGVHDITCRASKQRHGQRRHRGRHVSVRDCPAARDPPWA